MIKYFILALFLATTVGCNFSVFQPNANPEEPTFYDLGLAPKEGLLDKKFKTRGIYVGNVQGTFGNKIMLRTAENKIVFDPANRWAKLPEQMVYSYLNSFFSTYDQAANKKGAMWKLDVSIYTFEYNTACRQAYLGVTWKVVNQSTLKVIAQGNSTYSSNRQEKDTVNPGEAMTQCVSYLAAQVMKDVMIYEFEKKLQENKLE